MRNTKIKKELPKSGKQPLLFAISSKNIIFPRQLETDINNEYGSSRSLQCVLSFPKLIIEERQDGHRLLLSGIFGD